MASEHPNTHATVEVDPHGGHAAHGGGPLSPDAQMVVWTWVTFGIVAFILHKVAWKPILAGLDAREQRIRDSLEEAQRVKLALAEIEQSRQALHEETQRECRTLIAQAREAATAAAAQVDKTAHERVKVLYENAERDIAALRNRVVADLRREQAELICSVSGRLIGQKLDNDQNRALVDRLISEF